MIFIFLILFLAVITYSPFCDSFFFSLYFLSVIIPSTLVWASACYHYFFAFLFIQLSSVTPHSSSFGFVYISIVFRISPFLVYHYIEHNIMGFSVSLVFAFLFILLFSLIPYASSFGFAFISIYYLSCFSISYLSL